MWIRRSRCSCRIHLQAMPSGATFAGVYVYKFTSQNELVLLAYEFDPKTRHLLLLGSHENFYRELKR